MGDSRIEPNPFGSEGYAFPHTTTTGHLHISHNAPYLPTKVLHNLCFSFLLGITSLLHSRTKNGCVADYRVLLGITAVPREIENIALWDMCKGPYQERIKGTEKASSIHTLFHR